MDEFAPLLVYAGSIAAKELVSMVAALGVAWLGSKVVGTGLKTLMSKPVAGGELLGKDDEAAVDA